MEFSADVCVPWSINDVGFYFTSAISTKKQNVVTYPRRVGTHICTDIWFPDDFTMLPLILLCSQREVDICL